MIPMVDYEEKNKKNQKLCGTDHDTFYLLESLEFPMTKIILESSNVTNIGRFILLMWINSRPHNLSITAARNGLKKCGAINLICFETNWVWPLPDLYIIIQLNIKNKNQNERSGLMDQKPRIKNSFYWSATIRQQFAIPSVTVVSLQSLFSFDIINEIWSYGWVTGCLHPTHDIMVIHLLGFLSGKYDPF